MTERTFSEAEQDAEAERQFVAKLQSDLDQLRRERDEALRRRDAVLAEACNLRILALSGLPDLAMGLARQRADARHWAMSMPRPRR